MDRKEMAVMMNAWVKRKTAEHDDAYVVGYLQSIIETLATHDTIALKEAIKHFGPEE